MSEDKPEDARRLYQEAMHKLEEREYDEAIALGERMKRLRFSGGFEVVALARAAQDDREGAVTELREAVSVAPSVWVFWHMLGNQLSDLGRFDEALDAYGRALGCARVDAGAVHYDRALALHRAERHQEALAAADEVPEGPARRHAAILRLSLLNALGRHDEVLATSEGVLALIDGDDADDRDRGRVLGERAIALLDGQRDAAAARQEAARAVGNGSFIASAAGVLRRVRAVRSNASRGYQLRVKGRWPVEDEPTGFLRIFQVVADTPEQALAYVGDFEPEEARASLGVEDFEDEPAPDALHGVHWASGHVFFPLKPEEPAEA